MTTIYASYIVSIFTMALAYIQYRTPTRYYYLMWNIFIPAFWCMIWPVSNWCHATNSVNFPWPLHCSLYTITTTATPHNNSKKPSDNNFYVFFVNHKTFPPNRIGRIGYETISNPEDNEDLSDAFHSVHPIPEFVPVIVWDILRTCSLLWVLRCWGLVYWGDNHISCRWNEF